MKTKELIYDVGMNNGDDTAFYLSQGYRVIAVEADPALAAAGRERFRQVIGSGDLKIENVGIADHEGEAEFWICDDHSEWNSFDRSVAARDGCAHHKISIPTRRFASILREHGAPHYVKIDIEGSDELCLADLAEAELPQYVSLESECAGSVEHIDESEGLGSLKLLERLGYRRFKLIDQITFVALARYPTLHSSIDWAGRGLSSPTSFLQTLGLVWLRRKCKRLTQRARLEREFKQPFPPGCSGPWGESTPGSWMNIDQAMDTYVYWRKRHFREQSSKTYSFWCDWHASL